MIKLDLSQDHKDDSTYANKSTQYATSTKDKNHTIISIDEEKAFEKTQHPFMIKPLAKMGTEGTYVNIIKTMKKPQPTQYSTLKS